MTDQASPDSTAASSTPSKNNDSAAATPKKSTDDPLLQSIKNVITLTNSALASFEEATDENSTMLVSRLQTLAKQGRHIATRAISTYEHRGQYGPQIVAGSATAVGAIIAMRRGKIPGALAGGLAGAAAYGNVYGYEDFSATSWRRSVPKKKE
ncbi:hypothetical protein ACHAXR_002611 [Thalassiosira sp. AJA248-18]